MRNNMIAMFIVLLCILVILPLIGCRKDLENLCKDWQQEVIDYDQIISRAEMIHDLYPKLVTRQDLEWLETKRDDKYIDALEICIVDKIVPND